MNKKILRVGIVGYGVVGKRRRYHIDRHPLMKTVIVCDQFYKGKAQGAEDVKCVSDYKELLTEDLDVLFVSLPNYLAPEVTIAGLERGLHVFCEKPPGRFVSDVEDVIQVEKKHPHLKLKYGFNHRYHDSVREALRIIRSGDLGDVVNMRGVYGKSQIIPIDGQWRSQRKYAGGGILLDQGIHMIDLMQLVCGEFTEVKSFVSNSYWNHDVEDNAYAIMKDSSGRIAMLHSSATQWLHRFSLEIALKEGLIELHGILSGSKSYGQEKLIITRRDDADANSQKEQTINYLDDNSWRDEVYEFADSIVSDEDIQWGTSEDALSAMKLVYKIYESDPQWSRFLGVDVSSEGTKVVI